MIDLSFRVVESCFYAVGNRFKTFTLRYPIFKSLVCWPSVKRMTAVDEDDFHDE